MKFRYLVAAIAVGVLAAVALAVWLLASDGDDPSQQAAGATSTIPSTRAPAATVTPGPAATYTPMPGLPFERDWPPAEPVSADPALPFQLTPGLYVFEFATGEVRRLLSQEGFDLGGVDSYDWSADSQWLVTGSTGSTDTFRAVRLDGARVKTAEGQVWRVERLQDGSFALHLRIGGPEAPEFVGRLDLDSMRVEQLATDALQPYVSPDGRYLLTPPLLATQALELIDLQTGTRQDFLPMNYLPLAWAPDSERMVFLMDSLDPGPRLVVVSRDDPQEQVVIGAGQDAVWSPDGAALAIVDYVEVTGEGYVPQISIRQADGAGSRVVAEGVQPNWSPDGGSIAYIRDGAIWRLDLATGTEVGLVGAPLDVVQEPRWSPDGRFLAFRAGAQTAELRVLDVASGDDRYVGVGLAPRWSPDGERIAFLHGSSGLGFFGSVATMAADGGDIRRVGQVLYSDVVNPCQGGMAMDWSPDSSQLIYERQNGESVRTVAWDGTGEVVYPSGLSPVWSPSGNQFAFVQGGFTGACTVVVQDLGGGGQQAFEGYSKPAWSPDGSRLAVETSYATAPTHVVVLSLTGAAPLDLGVGQRPRWSPDGANVAFLEPGAAGDWTNVALVVLSDSGSPVAKIAVEGYVSGFDWSPDSASIAYAVYGEQTSLLYVVELSAPDDAEVVAKGRSPDWSPDGSEIVYERGYGE